MEDQLRYTIALMGIKGVGSILARHLIDAFGSAQAVLEANDTALLQISRVGQAIIEQRRDPRLMQRADAEIQFMHAHHIQPLIFGQCPQQDDQATPLSYPHRLSECQDAPTLLFKLGSANLESKHIVSIVGTRSCSQYGRDMVNRFVAELKEALPDLVIVSGLALGIDVSAHKAALEHGVPTVGVVAHGLDRIYPYIHKGIAREMVQQGGAIVTEYTTGTEPERHFFLARNRIIAGLSDAVIVVESKDKGGSLVTASIALDYNRDVFAFPGRVGDSRSEGCNRLIRLNRAGLITCAQDFIEAMSWSTPSAKQKSIQHSIPFEEENLSRNARLIIDALRDRGDLLLSQLSEATGLDHATLYEELLDLEMDGKIRSTPGGLYQLR